MRAVGDPAVPLRGGDERRGDGAALRHRDPAVPGQRQLPTGDGRAVLCRAKGPMDFLRYLWGEEEEAREEEKAAWREMRHSSQTYPL